MMKTRKIGSSQILKGIGGGKRIKNLNQTEGEALFNRKRELLPWKLAQ